MDSRYIYKETEYQLSDAIGFSQYVLDKQRLITLIGELHEKEFKCQYKSISIDDYCIKRLSKNSNCRILLEYNAGANPNLIGSKTIRNIYNKLENKNKIIPYDYRSYFLGVGGQNDLYTRGFLKYKSREDLYNSFVKPYYDKISNNSDIFKINNKLYSLQSYKLLFSYNNFIQEKFNKISIILQDANYNIKNNIHTILKEIWKHVCDYFLLKILLVEDNAVNEMIVVLGKKHYTNVADMFSKKSNILQILSQNNKGEGNCVRLFKICEAISKNS